MTTPTPSDRDAAIANLTSWMVQAGVSPEDAEIAAPHIIDGQDAQESE